MDKDRFPILEALHADGPAPDRAAQMMLYGQFVGAWEGHLTVHRLDGSQRETECGDDIVQEYVDEQGLRFQWCFTEITAESFHWLWRESKDGGEAWNVRYEFFLRRRDPDPRG